MLGLPVYCIYALNPCLYLCTPPNPSAHTDFHLLDPKTSPLQLGVDPASECTLCLTLNLVAATAAATLQKA